jgi:hypothetical protein
MAGTGLVGLGLLPYDPLEGLKGGYWLMAGVIGCWVGERRGQGSAPRYWAYLGSREVFDPCRGIEGSGERKSPLAEARRVRERLNAIGKGERGVNYSIVVYG